MFRDNGDGRSLGKVLAAVAFRQGKLGGSRLESGGFIALSTDASTGSLLSSPVHADIPKGGCVSSEKASAADVPAWEERVAEMFPPLSEAARARIRRINAVLAEEPEVMQGLQIGGKVGRPGDIPATLKWLGNGTLNSYPFGLFREKWRYIPGPSDKYNSNPQSGEEPKVVKGQVEGSGEPLQIKELKHTLAKRVELDIWASQLNDSAGDVTTVPDAPSTALVREELAQAMREQASAVKITPPLEDGAEEVHQITDL